MKKALFAALLALATIGTANAELSRLDKMKLCPALSRVAVAAYFVAQESGTHTAETSHFRSDISKELPESNAVVLHIIRLPSGYSENEVYQMAHIQCLAEML